MQFFRRILSLNPLQLLSFTLILSVLRTVVPFANYLFIPFFCFLIIYVSIGFMNGNGREIIEKFLRYNYPVLLIALFVFIGIILTSSFSFISLKELLYTGVILAFCFSFFLFIREMEEYNEFNLIFRLQLIWISIIVTVLGLLKFLLQLRGIDLAVLQSEQMIVGTSLINDYNYYCLFSVIALFALMLTKTHFSKFAFALISVLFVISILFSGSRRGIVFMMFLGLVWFLFGSEFRINIRMIIRKAAFMSMIVAVLAITFFAFRNHERFLKHNQSPDLEPRTAFKMQKVTAQLLFRYLTVLNSKMPYLDFYNKLWKYESILDSKMEYGKFEDPSVENNLIYNGNFRKGLLFWAPDGTSTRHQIVKTPYGKGIRVSRFDGDDAGWPLLYSGRNVIFYSGHTYTLNFKFRIVKGEAIPFKVGYWVNDSYRGFGEAVSLALNITDLDNGWKEAICTYSFIKSHFSVPFFINSQKDSTVIELTDISLKDSDGKDNLPAFADEISDDNSFVVQFLNRNDSSNVAKTSEIHDKSNLFSNGDFNNNLDYWKANSDSTILEIVDTPFGKGVRISRGDGDGGSFSLYYDGRPIIYYKDHEYKVRFLFKVAKGSGIPFNTGWWVNDAGQGYLAHRLPLNIKDMGNGWKQGIFSYSFKETHHNLPSFLNCLQDNTIIEISKVELTDLERNDSLPLFVDQLNDISQMKKDEKISQNMETSKHNIFYGPRTDRWKYSFELFRDSTSTAGKIFGIGFDYMKIFGTRFGEVEYDYPHNPFLSAFLYSGIIGGLAYIWFMFLVFFYYIKYYRHHIYFFICFLVTFYFSFFSVNTHFTIAAFAFFSIIPFLTRYLVENEKEASDALSAKTNH
jgi:hypothetical protein